MDWLEKKAQVIERLKPDQRCFLSLERAFQSPVMSKQERRFWEQLTIKGEIRNGSVSRSAHLAGRFPLSSLS